MACQPHSLFTLGDYTLSRLEAEKLCSRENTLSVNCCPNQVAIAESNKPPSYLLLFLYTIFQLLGSPIHHIAQTGKPGFVPFALFSPILM